MAKHRTAHDLLSEDEARTKRAVGSAALEKRNRPFAVSEPTGLIDFLGAKSVAGANVSEATALTESAVNACVGILADMIGTLPVKLYQKTADGREEAVEHPASELITVSPNGHHTPFEFRRSLQVGCGLGGNGYALVKRDANFRPIAINRIAPSKVHVKTLPDGSPVYQVEGIDRLLTRKDVLHVCGLGTDGLTGLSPIRMLREDIGLALTQREEAGRIYSNGARFPGILVSPAAVNGEKLKEVREAWDARHAGTFNSGRTPVLHGGWDYKSAEGMTLADAEFLASRAFSVETIARYYRIPLHLLQSTQKTTSWGTGLEQMNQATLTFTVNPWLVNWEQSLGMTLLTAAEQRAGLYFKFNRNALLQATTEARANYYRVMRDIGALSINDVRRREEENDLPDNIGDNYMQPFNGSGGFSKTSGEVMAASTSEEDAQ